VRANDDAQDAVVCVLAAHDYLKGKVIRPSRAEVAAAKKEGWIWLYYGKKR